MIKLLIVDDEEEIREEIKEYFAELGYELLEASDGGQAIQLLRKQPFDVVISDLIMPHSSGEELVNYIRERDGRVIIVVIAGTYVKTQIDNVVAGGADEVLYKPFELKELREVVENLLQQRNKTRLGQ